MAVTPFLLLKRRDAEQLAERVAAASVRWSSDWQALPVPRVDIAPASDHAMSVQADWRRYALSDGSNAWVDLPQELLRHIEQSLFALGDLDAASDRHLSSEMATHVAIEALDELAALLIGETSQRQPHVVGSDSIPPHLFKPGSGAVIGIVDFGASKPLRFVLSPDAVPRHPAPVDPRPPIAGLRRALGRTPVRLSVEIGRSQLTLGYLRNLAVGDVVALPTRIDDPLRVLGPAGDVVCHAHLGTVEGHHAVDLVVAPDAYQSTMTSRK